MTTCEQITLYRTQAGWMARTDSREVAELFGTDVLPTAYTAVADADTVLDAIRKLNPDADVRVAC